MLNLLIYKYEEPIHIILFNWINIGNLNINIGILLDNLSMIIIVPIGIVSFFVLLYSLNYMYYDPKRNLFYIIISIFAIFMILLIISDNYIMMFINWELIGVISYLLISFWNTRISAMKSALSALLLNRFGDTFFILFICFIISLYNSVDFTIIELLIPYTNTFILNLLAFMILIAAIAKSAQLGLHSWLLWAMDSPTPVSSLLHAATMVCSGIYLLIRSYFILEYTPSILLIILLLGGITSLISGLIAVVSYDIKKIIALSTISQLAIMMIAIGTSSYDLAIYHLYCHAFFKSLLFMSAGSIIHSFISENQDIRKLGGLINYLPFNYIIMFIASLSLIAIPGLSGYYSKDIILETLYGTYTLSSYIIYYITLISVTLTAIYSFRILYFTFYNNPQNNKYTYNIIYENSFLCIPMTFLAIYSIFLGYYRDSVIYHLNLGLNNNIIDTELSLPFIILYLPLISSLSFSFIFIYLYEFTYNKLYLNNIVNINLIKAPGLWYPAMPVIKKYIFYYFNQRIYYDQILNNIILRNILILSSYFNNYIDNGLLKLLGSTGFINLFYIFNYYYIIRILFILNFLFILLYIYL